ncbi:uncharacterized protein APUU_50813S [Aspergillus puulaauensis]|uniref:Uncharacterized protein n=1 Tax=Aspergillus puulaauensis TaxID=1220207 RepID=A0A7R7XRL7_9EURO|nr:uncharacterized protein APUU_50813S [Aspergillus puulaauensis]BCS26102.1 hypothetical protein APUU_50813S [Aspergillus puulaauensis]
MLTASMRISHLLMNNLTLDDPSTSASFLTKSDVPVRAKLICRYPSIQAASDFDRASTNSSPIPLAFFLGQANKSNDLTLYCPSPNKVCLCGQRDGADDVSTTYIGKTPTPIACQRLHNSGIISLFPTLKQ